MNKSEELVSNICTKTFLSLWSYRNPRGKDLSKELCDFLVICDPDIIIFSVKDIETKESGDIKIDWARWRKRAIEDSCKQIYGAERVINNSTYVITKCGKKGLPFPEKDCRRIHRIAIALGSKGKNPIYWGDFGKGFVHVFDEASFRIILEELNTITDFIKYLLDKEELCAVKKQLIFEGGEEDFLAFYLQNGRVFPVQYNVYVIGDGLWEGFTKKQEYIGKEEANKISYVWDRLIELFCEDFRKGDIIFGNTLTEVENVTRVMACEDRFSRRIMGKAFEEFISLASQGKVRSRKLTSYSNITYVFLATSHGENRGDRQKELQMRCFVARGLNPGGTTVVGIATEQYEKGKGFSLDAMYLYKPTWTEADGKNMSLIQKKLGYFKNPIQARVSEDEYSKRGDGE